MINEDELVRVGLMILKSEARKLWLKSNGKVCLFDLEEFGYLPLVNLVRKYESDRSSFNDYIAPRLRWALIDELRKQNHSRVSFESRVRAIQEYQELINVSSNPEVKYLTRERKEYVRLAASKLRGHSKKIVIRYYFNNQTFKHIAYVFGKDKYWANRQHNKALNMMRKEMPSELN